MLCKAVVLPSVLFFLTGCSSIGQSISRIGLCESFSEGVFCTKQKPESDGLSAQPSEQCNRNGIPYFCDDPALLEPSAIDIETRKNEIKRTLPKELGN